MASTVNYYQCSKPKFNLHRPFPKKLSFLTFSKDFTKSTPVRFPVTRASSSSTPQPSLLKRSCIALTASVALFSATYFITRSGLRHLAITAEETRLENHLKTQTNEVEALLSLAKIKFESHKSRETLEILNRLIEIEPHVQKWQLIKARMLSHNGQSEFAVKAFEEILAKDPNLVDAYHYLVMEYYNSKPKLIELEKRINEAIRRCKRKKKTKDIRGFRMLLAQIRVIEGNSNEAIRICEELVKDDPEDFIISVFRVLVYMFMGKEGEFAKQVTSVLEKNQQYEDYFDNKNNDSGWGAIVAYDEIFCCTLVFSKVSVASWFGY